MSIAGRRSGGAGASGGAPAWFKSGATRRRCPVRWVLIRTPIANSMPEAPASIAAEL